MTQAALPIAIRYTVPTGMRTQHRRVRAHDRLRPRAQPEQLKQLLAGIDGHENRNPEPAASQDRPRARSCFRSSTSSSPTEIRMNPSPMPASWRCSCVRRPWVVVAGWVMVLLVSPRFAVMEMMRVESITRHAAPVRLRPRTTRCRRTRTVASWRARAADARPVPDNTHASLFGCFSSHCANSKSALAVRLHAQRKRFQALEEHPGVERA